MITDLELGAKELRTQPFEVAQTPLVFVPYGAQHRAFDVLKATHRHRHGLALFQGPPLSGKTTIFEQFAAQLPGDIAVAIVDGTGLDATSLMQTMLTRFGYELRLSSTSELLNMIRVFAMQQSGASHPPLVVIENVHALNPSALEVLCELAAMTVDDASALRLVLAGTRSIKPIVKASAMKAVLKRLTADFQLGPLTRPESETYLHTKLRKGGCNKPEIILPRAVCDKLHAGAQGWPGLLDRLTLRALKKSKHRPVRVEHVECRAPLGNTVPELPVLKPVREEPTRRVKQGSAPRIVVTNRGRKLREMSLDGPRLLIGRSEHNDLRIDDELISRNHVLFIRHGETTFIMDLNSTNGTFLNGKRVSNQVVINNDIIGIGDARIKFIDPNARVRTILEGSGFNETTMAEALGNVRNALARSQPLKAVKSGGQ
jgi:general secretion pathway protein A